MNHAGEIAPLARLARPHVAVITAIEKAHIGFLGSIEAIADEKAAILRGLEPGGVAVLPADSPLLAAAARGRRRMPCRDVRRRGGRGCAADRDHRRCGRQRCRRGSRWPFRALPAECARSAHGDERAGRDRRRPYDLSRTAGEVYGDAARALEDFVPVTGRGARRQIAVPGGTALLLDESYNGNGASMRAALAVLRLQPAQRRHRGAGRHAGARRRRPGRTPRAGRRRCRRGGSAVRLRPADAPAVRRVPAAIRGAHAPDSAALAPIVARAMAPGDAILVKGSLGSRMKLVVDALERHGGGR